MFKPKKEKVTEGYIYIYIIKIFTIPTLHCAFFNRPPRHEGVLGSGSIAPLILNIGTRLG
jgi:hypothetical protein